MSKSTRKTITAPVTTPTPPPVEERTEETIEVSVDKGLAEAIGAEAETTEEPTHPDPVAPPSTTAGEDEPMVLEPVSDSKLARAYEAEVAAHLRTQRRLAELEEEFAKHYQREQTLEAEVAAHLETKRRLSELERELGEHRQRELARVDRALDQALEADLGAVGASFNFHVVLEALRAGRRLTRPGWHGRFIHFDAVQNTILRAVPGSLGAAGNGAPWQAVPGDLLANDWTDIDTPATAG